MSEPGTVRLAGEGLYLRPLAVRDVTERYRTWMNDPAVNRYLESRFLATSIDDLRAYVERKTRDQNVHFMAIVVADGDRHIGNIKLEIMDVHHRLAEIGIVIGEKDCWGRGYATQAIGLMSRHAFDDLGLHKLVAGSYKANEGSIRAFLKAGFSRECVCPKHYLLDGEFVDAVLLGLIHE